MTDKTQLGVDLAVDLYQLNEEMARQPGLFAEYSSKVALIGEHLKIKKLELEVFEAALDDQIRLVATSRGNKLTEKQVEMAIRRNDEWIARKKEVIRVETELAQLEGITKAFAQKKDMLSSITINTNSERRSFASVSRFNVVDPQ